jgi:hypothetical protein
MFNIVTPCCQSLNMLSHEKINIDPWMANYLRPQGNFKNNFCCSLPPPHIIALFVEMGWFFSWKFLYCICANCHEWIHISSSDGSIAVFYLSHNPSSKNWIIQLQAGGSCGSHKACHERAKGLYGSSKEYDLYMTGTFLSSDDPNQNPTFASWNKVYVPYCRLVLISYKRCWEYLTMLYLTYY